MASALLAVPLIRQKKDGECVPACAAMALAYIGIVVAYDRLVALLETDWFGTPSFKIQRLESLGVKVLYKHGSFAELERQLENNQPCIAFVKTKQLPYWDFEEDSHAVVVVGLDDSFVYVNDPRFAAAPIQVARGDFDLAWLEWDELYAVLMRRE